MKHFTKIKDDANNKEYLLIIVYGKMYSQNEITDAEVIEN